MERTYTFSGKERDAETGYSYFGARYYDAGLGIWLSVDPMTSKYPSLSAYVYCANNPLLYLDPNGMEVKYNSFKDKLITSLARVFNKSFREQFKELRKSDEKYTSLIIIQKGIIVSQPMGINYSNTDETREAGQTIFSNIRHETKHADQFEHGEMGFSNTGKGATGWEAMNYDIMDEVEAHNAQNSGFSIKSGLIAILGLLPMKPKKYNL